MQHENTIQFLGENVEGLETCHKMIVSLSPVQTRYALILLDHQAECLMRHKCGNILCDDIFRSKVLPPRFTSAERANIERHFPEKIRMLHKEKLISELQASVIFLGHSYRNKAQHSNTHNPSANRIIARVLFRVVCDLLSVVYDSGGEGGDFDKEGWLVRYGLGKGPLMYNSAVRIISEQLSKEMFLTAEEARAVLSTDIDTRLLQLGELVKKGLSSSSESDIDNLLKKWEFRTHYDDEAASRKYREAVYAIAQGNDYPAEEYKRREEEYYSAVAKAFRIYKPTVTWNMIQKTKYGLPSLPNNAGLDLILGRYQQLDGIMSQAEQYLAEAADAYDAAIQFEIDLKRGK